MLQPAAPIRLHTFALSGHAHRVELALSLMGLPFERVTVDLMKRAQRAPEFLALNPFGQVPAIEDGDVVVADSNAILVYLAQRYDDSGRWLPRDPIAAARVQRWFSVAAGELHDGAAVARWRTLTRQPVAPECRERAAKLFTLVEQHLQGGEWFVGSAPTLADITMYSYTAVAPEGRVPLEPYPALRAWLARVEALPGFVAMPRTPVPEAA